MNKLDKKYHIWTAGCQMNVADSRRLGSSLEHLGYNFTAQAKEELPMAEELKAQ